MSLNQNRLEKLELDKGIEFEGTDIKLPWDLPKQDLLKKGVPEISESGNFARWRKIKLFGKNLNLTVLFDQYENPNDKLIYIRLEDIENEDNPRKTYQEYSLLFTEIFGNPSEVCEFKGQPQKKWKFKNIELIIGIGERFEEFSVFVIKKTNTQHRV